MEKLIIYTDGSCRGNGKTDSIGGWGAVITYKGKVTTMKGEEKGTTNNRMEIMGAIMALERLISVGIRRTHIEICTDSAYLCNMVTCHWIYAWKKNNWRKKEGNKPVKNIDLLERLLKLLNYFPNLEFKKVKGHSDVEFNNLADKLATGKI